MGERAGPIGLLDALADLVLPRPCPGCGRAGHRVKPGTGNVDNRRGSGHR